MAENSFSYKVFPHNDGAERAVLGAILQDPTLLTGIQGIISADDFYNSANKEIYKALEEYSEEQKLKTLDIISFVDFLEKKDKLSLCGGSANISSLMDVNASTVTAPQYAEIISECSLRRRTILLGEALAQNSADPTEDIGRVIDDSFTQLSKLAENADSNSTDPSLSKYISQTLSNIKERMSGGKGDALSTGFDKLDDMTDGGFHPTDFVIIAARPSIGKTAFATSIIQNMVLPPNNYKVAFYSLEMSGVQVTQRLISSISRVPLKIIRDANFHGDKDRNFNAVFTAAGKLYDTSAKNSNLFLYEIPNMKLSDIKTTARRLYKEENIQCIFIDYIGLIESGLPANTARFEQVAYVSRNLKALARELNIPVVALCQVSREAEGANNEPQLNNLRDSGSIEQDADMVMFLHRNRKVDLNTLEKDMDGKPTLQRTKVIIAKQRNGETGDFHTGFHPQTASFVNLTMDAPPNS